MNAIAKAIDAINELFGRIIAPLIAIITLIVLYDIVSRFFFGRPSDWAFDITKMLLERQDIEDVDVKTMMRRTPLPDLYKYLKQQLEYKQLTLKREQSRAMPHKQERVILEELVVEDNVSEAEEVIEEEEIIEEEIDEEYIEEYIEEIE